MHKIAPLDSCTDFTALEDPKMCITKLPEVINEFTALNRCSFARLWVVLVNAKTKRKSRSTRTARHSCMMPKLQQSLVSSRRGEIFAGSFHQQQHLLGRVVSVRVCSLDAENATAGNHTRLGHYVSARIRFRKKPVSELAVLRVFTTINELKAAKNPSS